MPDTKEMGPATVAAVHGSRVSVQLVGERRNPTQTQAFRIAPDGDQMAVRGREAQTLRLLVEKGPRGFTSGEASPLHWARRTSQYVHKLRRLGVDVATVREQVGDARIGRYILNSPVVLLPDGEGGPCT